jgi:hypothetical protein
MSVILIVVLLLGLVIGWGIGDYLFTPPRNRP